MDYDTLEKEVFKLGEELVSEQIETEKFIDLLPTYIESFTKWSSVLSTPDKIKIENIRELSKLHELILVRATKMKISTKNELNSLRKKEQVLKAYVEKVPSRISLNRARKV